MDLAARDNLLTLTIDEEEGSPLKITNPFSIRTGDRYFFGGELVTLRPTNPSATLISRFYSNTTCLFMHSGCPKTNNTLFKCETKLNRFHGCMQHIFIDNEQLDIDITLQRQWARYEELLIGTCGITDRYEITLKAL